jgi:glycosyltransferase involved in cell wall biosynthesis
MGMGIPVLHGVAGESADIVKREGCGIVFEPENTAELAAHLLELQSNSGLRTQLREAGLRAAGRYDRKNLALAMLGVLQAIRAGDRH